MRAREVLQKARTTRGAGKMAEMAVCVCALPSPFVVGQAAGSAGVRARCPARARCPSLSNRAAAPRQWVAAAG